MSSSRRRQSPLEGIELQEVNLSDELVNNGEASLLSAPLTNNQPTGETKNKNSILHRFFDKFTIATLIIAAIILTLNFTLFSSSFILNKIEVNYSKYKTEANKTDEKDYCNKYYTEIPWQLTIFFTNLGVVAVDIFCIKIYWRNMQTQDERTKSWLLKSIKKRWLQLTSKKEEKQLSSNEAGQEEERTTHRKGTKVQLGAFVSPSIEIISIFMDALYMSVIEKLWILLKNEENLNDAKYLIKGSSFFIWFFLSLVVELLVCYKVDSYDVLDEEKKLEDKIQKETEEFKDVGFNVIKRPIDTYRGPAIDDRYHHSNLLPVHVIFTFMSPESEL